MIGQFVSAIESIDAGTIAAGDMAIVNVLGSEVLPVVASQVSSAIENSWAKVAGMAEGC
jgi:non-ribosomal peptide synthetase component E (peptide arylation enzyme)